MRLPAPFMPRGADVCICVGQKCDDMISLQNVFHAYINLGSRIWQQLPIRARNSSIAGIYGRHLHELVCRHSNRTQNHSTFFMRNRPEMELLRRIIRQKPQGAKLAVMVLACSKGAEVYSIMWTIRSARPDLKLHLTAIDISQEITDFAKNGTYSLEQSTEHLQPPSTDLTGRERLNWNTYREQGPLHNISLFERLSPNEFEAIFDINHDTATVKGWLKEDVTWAVGDAGDPSLAHSHGPQDIVVANRFLCHMEPQIAERCLRNIGRLIKPGGTCLFQASI